METLTNSPSQISTRKSFPQSSKISKLKNECPFEVFGFGFFCASN